ncbi:MAG: family 10 glycosylhydrolase [bacterium]|nr:family 10 glycosylhydrolase [bacterium]
MNNSPPLLCLLLAAAAGCGGAIPEPVGEPAPVALDSAGVRAIWVTRFDYKTRSDLETIFDNCVEAGFDTVLLQVRGNATAFYDSPFEPWAEQLGGAYPGFDPLACSVVLARQRCLSLHAWINLVPVWRGIEPPPTEGAWKQQLYNARPEWMWWDQHGVRQPLSERFYVSVNPCLPEVRDYLAEVVIDIAARYDLDGIHLDYARFPNEFPATPAGDIDYPHDPRTLRLYRAATGGTPEQARAGQGPWDTWRTEQVTETIRLIRERLNELEPPPQLSAAVNPLPGGGLEHFQDAVTWIEQGLVDALYPMNYASNEELFGERLDLWAPHRDSISIVMGIRFADTDHELTTRLIDRAVTDFAGFCLFGYFSLFDSVNEDIDNQDEATRAERARRRAVLLPYLRSPR